MTTYKHPVKYRNKDMYKLYDPWTIDSSYAKKNTIEHQQGHQDEQKIVEQLIMFNTVMAANLGLQITRVSFCDNHRYKNTVWGNKINDITICTESGTRCPIIRFPNTTDKVITVSSDKLAVLVGNNSMNKKLSAVTLQNYIKNFGQFNPSMGSADLNLSDNIMDTEIIVSVQAIPLPIVAGKTCEFHVEGYDYNGTLDNSKPSTIDIITGHLGTSVYLSTTGIKKYYLQKNIKGIVVENTFKSACLNSTQIPGGLQDEGPTKTIGAMSCMGKSNNVISTLHIPLLTTVVDDYCVDDYYFNQNNYSLDRPVYRSMNMTSIDYGDTVRNLKSYDKKACQKLQRDHTMPIRMTVSHYYTTDGKLSNDEFKTIEKTINHVYKHGDSCGELMTGVSFDQIQGVKMSKKFTHTPVIASDISSVIKRCNATPPDSFPC
jgi:hypothetical protein